MVSAEAVWGDNYQSPTAVLRSEHSNIPILPEAEILLECVDSLWQGIKGCVF